MNDVTGTKTVSNGIRAAKPSPGKHGSSLGARIDLLDRQLLRRYSQRLILQPSLSRSLVSFQANKPRIAYRWYKYKEAFSAVLVEHLLDQFKIKSGVVLDPFAGSGTTLFAACAYGLRAEGIELLPIGREIISARMLLEECRASDVAILRRWRNEKPWLGTTARQELLELRITEGAYPKETKDGIEHFLAACETEDSRARTILRFALLCILESVSYTRKDGQYLRWDYRSGRKQASKPFDKGEILEFDRAICGKLDEMIRDWEEMEQPTSLFPVENLRGASKLHNGSCLDVLPSLTARAFDAVITSPPYCNRYDYTRTYALELALLGVGEQELIRLRQQMLSCTVENRAKDLLTMNPDWKSAIVAADEQSLLQAILRYLESQKEEGELNNNGIPRMVRGYFYEMACVISECFRVMKSGALLVMVNDNVRYAGASISVDLILSEIAETLGFCVEQIGVLPNGKGNSSQQMGAHGREALRKCVYVWRKG